MYQAASVSEAKSIFEATLEDESSRAHRFDGLTLDVAALLAARGGWQGDAWFAGLFAPIGLQVAYRHVGLLVYPLDLAGYLVASGDKAQPPRVGDVVRFGATLYARPWPDVPLVVGAGADHGPTFDTRPDTRAFAVVALELPLYLLQ
jgi:hypothetical protein